MQLTNGRLRHSATDLAGFLACRHLTALDLAAAHGLVTAPAHRDLGAEDLARRGQAHEARVLAGFKVVGWGVEDCSGPAHGIGARAAATLQALGGRVDVVYQGALQVGDRLGLPDFLVRADLLGGGEGYEVVEAKLARSAKAGAVLQAAFYSRQLADLTGVEPASLHLALGDGEPASFRVRDVSAYERQVDRLFAEAIAGGPAVPSPDTYPEPAEHCTICRWRQACMGRRRADDDLSLVAGATSRQRAALKRAGIATRRGLAAASPLPRLEGVGRRSLERLRAQASIQVQGENAGAPRWELVSPERDQDGGLTANRGLLGLLEPAEGDLFFDIEGARYWSEDGREYGLQYLLGVVDSADLDETGRPRYHAFWAFDRSGERRAFEQVMDLFVARLARHPGAHIYHYNHYEPTALGHVFELHLAREEALGHLMGRFATREEELDDLLRRRVFVDLYKVVRQGVRASVESYSIKRLEPFYDFRRAVPLEEVNATMVGFEAALEEGTAAGDQKARAMIGGYNEDDCRSTLALRDWLEERRGEFQTRFGIAPPRPAPPAPAQQVAVDPAVAELRAALLEGIPGDPAARTREQGARALVADLLEYYRREHRPGWWRHFHLRELSEDELLEEPDAIAGLEFVGQGNKVKRSTEFRYRFPAQEHGFGADDRAVDPRAGRTWQIHEIDEGAGTLVIPRSTGRMAEPHPTALVAPGPEYGTAAQAQRLQDLARRILALPQGSWPADAALDLLLRHPPRIDGSGPGALRRPGEDGLAAGRRLAISLETSALAVQGPPGTGKTYTAARQILELVAAGRRVGVTATSHAVITHLLDGVAEAAVEAGRAVRIGQRADKDQPRICASARLAKDAAAARAMLDAGEIDVLGGTSWLWANEAMGGAIDVLVIDEAGQMSLADALACAGAATSLILLGDPAQLARPTQGSHPPGTDASALGHLLGGRPTLPEDLGLFLERTRRLHPAIRAFTSEVFYEDRLHGIDGLERQAILDGGNGGIAGSGLRLVPVTHAGNANAAPEEAEAVAGLIGDLHGGRWRDQAGVGRTIEAEDLLVITPFNAQARQIEARLDAAGLGAVRVGTVDRFQGRQGAVAIYSMASSSVEDAPRGMEFLYDLHRLNVATSRARCLAIVVASPDLLRVVCKTPDQMRLANALCRFAELAPPP